MRRFRLILPYLKSHDSSLCLPQLVSTHQQSLHLRCSHPLSNNIHLLSTVQYVICLVNSAALISHCVAISLLRGSPIFPVTRDNRISCKLLYQWTSKLRSLDSSEERDGATAVNDSETGVEVRIRKILYFNNDHRKKNKKNTILYIILRVQ